MSRGAQLPMAPGTPMWYRDRNALHEFAGISPRRRGADRHSVDQLGDTRLPGARRCAPIPGRLARGPAGDRCAALAVAADPARHHPAVASPQVRAQVPQDLVGRGAPLLDLSQRLRTELVAALAQRTLAPLTVELGMLYGGEPTVPAALRRLRESGAQRILVVPMFPQYCGATTGATYDQVNGELRRWRWLPELRYVAEYHDHPGYIDALRASVIQHWEAHGKTPHLLLSFHGIPERYFHKGDPYFCKCQKTARLLADELMLREQEWSVSFQSRFGLDGWLKPYTSQVLEEMPARGIRQLTVVCPGFAVDCLETLEEIDMENRQRFRASGGERFEYVPALNARFEHARFLADLVAQHCQGWTHDELGLRATGAERGASA